MQFLQRERRTGKAFNSKYKSGLLKLYAQHAVSSMKGAYMEKLNLELCKI